MPDTPRPPETTVGPDAEFHAVVWLGFPIAGALAGALLTFALDWIVGLTWAPFQGPLSLVDEVTGDWTLPVLAGVGVVLGLVLAVIAQGEAARVTVGPDRVTLTQDGDEQVVARESVACVFAENGRLVVQDALGRRGGAVRVEDLSQEKVRDAFVSHGYAWVEKDPWDDTFARWIQDSPALSPEANAILAARQKSLELKNGEETEDFREELAKVGVVVRDEGNKQFWRPLAP
ncbi:hypothetical protein [Nocardioides gilvus]|uniref:YqeB family protein n=1 Tax=Nocardioides gilvus TaxID=1735589 RepID=UPI000D749AE2|nr:hypothetical protein [Nocardioides gilvus]